MPFWEYKKNKFYGTFIQLLRNCLIIIFHLIIVVQLYTHPNRNYNLFFSDIPIQIISKTFQILRYVKSIIVSNSMQIYIYIYIRPDVKPTNTS